MASNGKEALDHLRATRFDVVLTDIVMPVLDGLDLCRAVQDEFPHVRLLAMSGNQAGQASLKAAPRFGAECVLKTPFSRRTSAPRSIKKRSSHASTAVPSSGSFKAIDTLEIPFAAT